MVNWRTERQRRGQTRNAHGPLAEVARPGRAGRLWTAGLAVHPPTTRQRVHDKKGACTESMTVLERVRAAGIEVRKAGKTYWALCPFHKEDTPSFNIDPSRGHGGSWHCYGCGRGGYEPNLRRSLNGEDATIRPVIRRSPAQQRTALERTPNAAERLCLDGAVMVWRDWLKHSSQAAAYLQGRGFRPEVVSYHHLGFGGRGGLLQVLIAAGLPPEAIESAGLVRVDDQDGRLHERMRGRIVIPEMRGKHALQATGRRLDTSRHLRYIDLPFDPVLYHLGCALQKGGQRVYVVEGQLDALACCQAGVAAVAIGSTYLSQRQVRELGWVLRRHSKQLIAWGDADEPGTILNEWLRTAGAKLCVAPAFHDAGEALEKGGTKAVRTEAFRIVPLLPKQAAHPATVTSTQPHTGESLSAAIRDESASTRSSSAEDREALLIGERHPEIF